MTISQLLEQQPSLRSVLQQKGIDMCCGGSLTVAQAAEVRGLPVSELIAALETTVSEPPLIGRSDSVRTILATYPGTVAVFEKHGLMGCGGSAGPEERIDLFATIHRIDVDTLLGELREAALGAPGTAPSPSAPEPAHVYPGFIKTALVATMTLGATFGAYNLLMIHWALGPVPREHVWIHAGYQLWGFVLLFIMGVSYHALPRFFGVELQHARLARTTLWLSVAALLAMTWGRFGAMLPRTAPVLLLGAALELAVVAGWLSVLAGTWRRARPRFERFHRFLLAGTSWWLVAALFFVADAVLAAFHGDTGTRFNEAVYAAVLFGGTLTWIQGMFLRTGPVFLNLKPTRERAVDTAFWLGLVGTVLAVIAGAGESRGARDIGLLLVSGSIAAFVLGVRPFSGTATSEGERVFARIVRLSFAAAIVFVVLAVVYAVPGLLGHISDRLIHDGARHAFTLGFVTLMIFAMAGRIIPTFCGAALRWPKMHVSGAYLIAFGMVLREAEVAVVWLREPWLMNISGVSGILEALGVSMAAISILGTLRAAARQEQVVDSDAEQVPISADANVAALIGAHEEALPILIEAGFTPLANPLLRRTLARAVTLRQACRMHGIDLEQVLERIRQACPHQPRQEVRAATGEVQTGIDGAVAAVAPPVAALSESRPPDRDAVLAALHGVVDPELGVDIVALGLIYGVEVDDGGAAKIRMTLTAPGCPHGYGMAEEVRAIVSRLGGIKNVDVDLVFDPPWTPDRMGPEARHHLGLP